MLRIICAAICAASLSAGGACRAAEVQTISFTPAGAFLGAPPAAGSPEELSDQAAREFGLTLRNTDRGRQAAEDSGKNNVKEKERMLSAVLGTPVGKTETPAFHKMLKSLLANVDAAVDEVKSAHPRPRPYALHPEDETCRRDRVAKMNPQRSYPSGHAALAWAAGLAAAAAVPEKADAIFARMRDAGDSRWICGQHWLSDVRAGRELAAAVFAQWSSSEAFRENLPRARGELEKNSAR